VAPAPGGTAVPAPPATGDAALAPAAGATPVDKDLAQLKLLPHYCDPGDTLDGIAIMYDSKKEWILKANPTVKTDADLKKGMKISVPVDEP
jgi:hypothetical protein